MPYPLLDISKKNEKYYRKIWKENYCNSENLIYTFDNIRVKFYEDMFDHAFFESANRKMKDKSILSFKRLKKMLWIKDVLNDANAIVKQGWMRDKKKYTRSRRVALVKDNYIVIIRIINLNTAKFLTAYEIDNNENLNKILNSPDWK